MSAVTNNKRKISRSKPSKVTEINYKHLPPKKPNNNKKMFRKINL